MFRYLGLCLLALFACVQADAARRVILDTDIDSDVDDAGALAMLLNLHARGVVDLRGIVVTSDDTYAALCTQAICTFYGYPDMPIGVNVHQANMRNHSRYTRQIAEEFPRAAGAWTDFEEAASLYRRLLAESPDSSVTVLTIGHLSSLRDLLRSAPDGHSPLTGVQLAGRKVSRWLCMGGRFPEGKEANFYRPDPEATLYCLDNWPGRAVFSGWEIGREVRSGGPYLKRRFPDRHPVRRAYELYNRFAGRASWDQTAVLLLTDRADDFFGYRSAGRCVVMPDGSNRWEEGPEGYHSCLVFREGADRDRAARLIDRLIAGDRRTLRRIGPAEEPVR